jgi:hypothetical protein
MDDKLLHAVTITASTRHGRTKLHTFAFDESSRQWFSEAMPTRKQREERGRFVHEHPAPPVNHPEPDKYDKSIDRQISRLMARRPELGVPYGVSLQAPETEPTIHLARGVDIAADTLSVILDALHSDGRHEVDIRDIKMVVSQVGSDIARLDSVPSELRQHAEKALYTEILRRCTNLESVISE